MTDRGKSAISQTLKQAQQAYDAGQYESADHICRQILGTDQNCTAALHLAVMIALQQGQLKQAADLAKQAVAGKPDAPSLYNLLGLILAEQGQFEQAEKAFRQALAIDAGYVEGHYNLGNTLNCRGRAEEAVAQFQTVVRLKPDWAAAYYHLANARRAQGQLEAAIVAYQQALQLQPDYAEVYHNLGGALKARGDITGAIDSYQLAVRFKGDFAEAYNNLANALIDDGQPQAAIRNFRLAISIRPDYGLAHYNLANLYRNLGRTDEAINSFHQAIACQPGLVAAHSGLGHLHLDQGQFNKAAICFQNALRRQPDLAEAWNGLGAAFMAQGLPEKAICKYRRALELMPSSAQTLCNLANALLYLGRFDDAADSCRRAIDHGPNLVEAHTCMGDIYYQKGEFERAIGCYQKVVALRPDGATPYNNMGNAYQNLGKLERAVACYQKALDLQPEFFEAQNNIVVPIQLTCDWKGLQRHGARLDGLNKSFLDKGLRTPEDPFVNLTRQADPARNYEVARSWSRDIARQARNLNHGVSFNHRHRQSPKITIGYLSNNFGDHPVAHQTTGLFACHDRDDFNIYCYSYGRDDGSVYRKKIQRDCDKFVDLSAWNHTASAALINTDGVDILVDLVGLTNGNRSIISALRPAPLQISYLGMLGTTGADYYDYILTDRIVTPAEHQKFYSEKFIYMPHCYQINDNTRRIAARRWTRTELGLPQDGFVFCSFNNSYKFEPVMFDTWMRILRQVPGSVLWLSRGNAAAACNLSHEAEKRGIDPQRLVFADKLPLEEHLARLKLADLALDTRIYNGGATTSNALWVSVPVITLLGSHFVSRMSASALAAVGLEQMIASGLKAYEKLAVGLALNPDRLLALRQKLDDNRLTEPLFDTPRFVKNLEKAYRKIWHIYRKGHSPKQVEIGA